MNEDVNKIWLTRAKEFIFVPDEETALAKTETRTAVAVYYKQKPAWNNAENGKFWWTDCRGKLEYIPTKVSKLLFGVIPKENEIYTAEKINGSFKITNRQTPRDCPCTNTGIRFSMDW